MTPIPDEQDQVLWELWAAPESEPTEHGQTGPVGKIRDYLLPNIVATFCMFPPFGLLGVWYSLRTRFAQRRGLEKDAKRFAELAENLFFGALIVLFGALVVTASAACPMLGYW